MDDSKDKSECSESEAINVSADGAGGQGEASASPSVELASTPQQVAHGVKPPNYPVWSILATLFGCQVTGICSIYLAVQVGRKWADGDYSGSLYASKAARTWAWISVVLQWSWIVLFWIGVGCSQSS